MGQNLNPLAVPCKPRPRGYGPLPRATPENKEPRLLRGGAPRSGTENAYFGGALEDESVEDFDASVLFLCLWVFFFGVAVDLESELDDEAAGVAAGVEAGGVDWANAGPAIRARAMTGMSFLNMWSPEGIECAQRARKRPYYYPIPHAQGPYDRKVMLGITCS